MSAANRSEMVAFFKTYSETKMKLFREASLDTLETLQEHISLFRWFNQRTEFNHLCTIKEKESWKTLRRGEIKHDYPPLEDIEFKSFYNENIIAKPLQYLKDSEENKAPKNKEIKCIHAQNNYSNIMLSSTASQVFKLEEILNPLLLKKPLTFFNL